MAGHGRVLKEVPYKFDESTKEWLAGKLNKNELAFLQDLMKQVKNGKTPHFPKESELPKDVNIDKVDTVLNALRGIEIEKGEKIKVVDPVKTKGEIMSVPKDYQRMIDRAMILASRPVKTGHAMA